MLNLRLLSGVFEGCVIEEGTQILDMAFAELDDDLQERILQWGKSEKDGDLDPDSLKEYYENSWDTEETEAPVDLKPVSDWE